MDVGNTRIKYCLFDNEKSIESHSLVHNQRYKDVLKSGWTKMNKPDEVWVSNVAGEAAKNEILEYCVSHWGIQAHFVEVEKQFDGINNHYEHLEQMGVDRWLAVIGARNIFPDGAVIVVDAGTAVNIELLTGDNQYMGGVILPGMNLMYQALMGNTHISEAKLDKSALDNLAMVPAIGQSTEQCVNAGVQYGLLGAVERTIRAMQAGLSEKTKLLITGSGAAWLYENLQGTLSNDTDDLVVESNLVLLGLARVATCAK